MVQKASQGEDGAASLIASAVRKQREVNSDFTGSLFSVQSRTPENGGAYT